MILKKLFFCLACSLWGMPAFLLAQYPLVLNPKAVVAGEEDTFLSMTDLLKNSWDSQQELADLFHNRGVFEYNKKHYEKAIFYTEKAVAIRQIVLYPFQEDLGKSYHNLGAFYRKIEKFEMAEKNLQSAIRIFSATGNDRVSRSLLELGGIYRELGDFDRAIQAFDLAINNANKFNDNIRMVKGRLEFGYVLHEKGLYQRAIDSLLLVSAYFQNGAPSDVRAFCYNNLCRSYYSLKDYDNCIYYGDLAIKELTQFKIKKDLGAAYNNVGLAHLKLNQLEEARKCFLKGDALGKQFDMRTLVAQSQDNLAEYYIRMGAPDQALKCYHNAVMKEVNGAMDLNVLENPSEKDIELMPSKADLLIYLSDKAKALMLLHQKSGDPVFLTQALQTYKRCDFLVGLLRREHTEQSTKLFWRENVMPIYEKAIEASYIAGDYSSAFLFFEKSRSVLLLDAMINAEAIHSIGDATLIREEQRLTQALLKAREQLETSNKENRIIALENLRQLNIEFETFTSTVSKKYPNYHKAKFETKVDALSTFRSNQLLGNHTALLHYFLGQEKSWLLALTGDAEPVFKDLGPTVETEQLVGEYLAFFKNSYAIANDPEGYIASARALFNYLVAPAGLSGVDELIIVPDGVLGFVPFEALVTKPVEDYELSRLPYLINDYSIRLSFSATILGKQGANPGDKHTLLGFAPFSAGQGIGNYPALSYSKDELSTIEKKVAGAYFTGSKATKELFMQETGHFSVVHLSTHAEANEAGGQPIIVFADTVLTLQELYGMKIPSDLVVLSACETNIGEVKSGEGIFSLSRGFTYAGAHSIIASLWNVNAASTGKIFPVFYDKLRQGSTKASALRAAKLEYISKLDESGHIKTPYDWAAFTLMGNNETIELESPSNPWGYFLIPLVIFTGFFVIRKKIKEG
ncbi:MAG: CHAT domain-containing protein [Saprospiraceae bacterium]|nr:CHAT domain-containing protein [Saprospiraceae bacterium]MCB9325809.1 CHAT domain-containing protein [Lewinellaceae bacterium]